MLRLALTPRWLGYLALTVVFAVVASLFGLWQWDRREQAVAKIEQVSGFYDRDPVALEGVAADSESSVKSSEWLPVMVSGEYVPADQVLVRTRPRSGSVGFEVLVPLRLGNGDTVVVNRGWVPTGERDDSPDVVPEPPLGQVSVIARIRPPEPALPGRSAPSGQLASIDLGAFQAIVDYPLRDTFYLELVSETPAPQVTPVGFPRPVPDEGPHLSYTLQWFVFAIMAFVAYLWLLRAEYRQQQGFQASPSEKKSDAEEEDALLDRRALTPRK